MHVRIFAARWHSYRTCPECNGLRLNPDALAFKIGEKSISQLNAMTVTELTEYFNALHLSAYELEATKSIREQIHSRLDYLKGVGLEYLQLNRPLRTLSGGEQTRVNLTSVLGSNLVNMLYVLDEPTVGLHPSDSERLVDVIERLRDRGNSVLVVEHEPPLINRADHLIEIGPYASRKGGEVVFVGKPSQLKNAKTLTAEFLFGKKKGLLLRRDRKLDKYLLLRMLGATTSRIWISRSR